MEYVDQGGCSIGGNQNCLVRYYRVFFGLASTTKNREVLVGSKSALHCLWRLQAQRTFSACRCEED